VDLGKSVQGTEELPLNSLTSQHVAAMMTSFWFWGISTVGNNVLQRHFLQTRMFCERSAMSLFYDWYVLPALFATKKTWGCFEESIVTFGLSALVH